MLTIYGVLRSRATRPLWLLGEIGMSFNHVPVIQAYRLKDPAAADAPLNTASPAYLRVNPQGQIPAMEEDGLILTESLGMTLYIAKRHGGDLGPRDLSEEALMIQWTLQAVTGIETPALEILYTYANGEATTPEGQGVIAIAAEKLRRPFRRLDAHLAGTDYMVGNRFTVADINVAECVRYAQGHAPLMAEFPALSAWLGRVQARPAFAAMMEKRLAEPA